MARGDLVRFTFVERVVHWLVGFSLGYVLITGMAFSYPKLFWLLNLFGGAPTARWLHPWVGLVFTAGIVWMFITWARDMRITKEDRAWFCALSH